MRTILVTNDLPRSLYTCCKSCCCGGRLGTAAVITSKPQWGVKTFLLSCVSEMDGHFFYKQLVTESVGSYSTPISQGNFLHSDPKMNRQLISRHFLRILTLISSLSSSILCSSNDMNQGKRERGSFETPFLS